MKTKNTSQNDKRDKILSRQNKPLRVNILHNVSWLSAGTFLVKPIWLLFITALCMRILQAHEYGVLNNCLAVMMMFAPVADLGTGNLVIRDVARDLSKASSYFSNTLLSRFGLSIPAFLLGFVLGWALGFDTGELSALAFAGIYVMSLRQIELCRSFYRAFEVLKYESISLVVEKILVVGGGILMLLTTKSAEGTLGGMTLGITLTLSLNLLWIHSRLTPFRMRLFRPQASIAIFKTALPLGIVMLLTMMYLRIGGIILEAVAGEIPAAQYYAAFRIVEALQVLPMIVVAAILPRLSSLFHQGRRDQFSNILKRSIASTAIITLCSAIALTFWGSDIIRLLDPSLGFDASGRVLQMICWALPLMTVNYILVAALIASNEHRHLVIIMALVLLANGAIVYILAPYVSYFGAVIGLLASECIVLAATTYRIRRVIGNPYPTQ